MLLVLKLRLVINHGLHVASLKVEVKFKVVLGACKLQGLFPMRQLHLDQRIVLKREIADFVRCALTREHISNSETSLGLFHLPVTIKVLTLAKDGAVNHLVVRLVPLGFFLVIAYRNVLHLVAGER